MPASGRYSHKGQKERQKNCHSAPAASFSPVFVTRIAGLNKAHCKIEPIDCLVGIWELFCSVTCKQLKLELFRPQFTSSLLHQSCRVNCCRVNYQIYQNLEGMDWCSVWAFLAALYCYNQFLASHPLGLFACFFCRRVKIKVSYPITQLSGPKMVKVKGR